MAITKSLESEDEKKRNAFISKGKEKSESVNIQVYIPTKMLLAIEKDKESWQSRNAWILDAIHQKLTQDKGWGD